MRIVHARDAQAAAERAAALVEAACADAIGARGKACVAFSGGETPWLMLERLRHAALPWEKIFVAQVDERIAPPADPRRNLLRLRELLVSDGPLPAGNLLAMPVWNDDSPPIGEGEGTVQLEAASRAYQAQLEAISGAPLRLDFVQLGLGADGHTASLVPDDPVLQVTASDVAISATYQGTRRMTLTLPAINRARARLWLVTGAGKRAALVQLLSGHGTIPAARVADADATLVTDIELER